MGSAPGGATGVVHATVTGRRPGMRLAQGVIAMIQQPTHPHLTLLPATTTGRWSVALALISVAALAVFYLMAGAGQTGGDSFADNWLLTGPILVVLVAGVGGLLAAIVAILRSGERGVLLALPILWGLVVTSFTLGELLVPH
jgi:hypothetical protein